MASLKKWSPPEPPLAPVGTLDAIASGRAHVRQAELEDKSAAAVTRLQSMVRARKQKSKYAKMLYDALLLKETETQASSANNEADAQFRRRKAVEELEEELQARHSIMFAESENAALGSMSARRKPPTRKGSSKQLYISGMLAEARATSASDTHTRTNAPQFSRVVSAPLPFEAAAAGPAASGSTHRAPHTAATPAPDPHIARSNVLARMRRVPSSHALKARTALRAPPQPPQAPTQRPSPPYPTQGPYEYSPHVQPPPMPAPRG